MTDQFDGSHDAAGGRTENGERLETDSPDDAASVCGYCGRPFARQELLALHRGHIHLDELTDEHREAFEQAYEDEQQEIRLFRLKALGALVLVYFGFLMVYAVV